MILPLGAGERRFPVGGNIDCEDSGPLGIVGICSRCLDVDGLYNIFIIMGSGQVQPGDKHRFQWIFIDRVGIQLSVREL
jgi:hypothetical protein